MWQLSETDREIQQYSELDGCRPPHPTDHQSSPFESLHGVYRHGRHDSLDVTNIRQRELETHDGGMFPAELLVNALLKPVAKKQNKITLLVG